MLNTNNTNIPKAIVDSSKQLYNLARTEACSHVLQELTKSCGSVPASVLYVPLILAVNKLETEIGQDLYNQLLPGSKNISDINEIRSKYQKNSQIENLDEFVRERLNSFTDEQQKEVMELAHDYNSRFRKTAIRPLNYITNGMFNNSSDDTKKLIATILGNLTWEQKVGNICKTMCDQYNHPHTFCKKLWMYFDETIKNNRVNKEFSVEKPKFKCD